MLLSLVFKFKLCSGGYSDGLPSELMMLSEHSPGSVSVNPNDELYVFQFSISMSFEVGILLVFSSAPVI